MSASVFLNSKHIEELLELLDKKDEIDRQIRSILAGAVYQEPKPASTSRPAIPETGIEIPPKGWTSYKTKAEAGPNEDSWRFASDRDGNVYPEVGALVDRIYESGKLERGSFTYTLSKDSKFLQRRKMK